MTQILGVKFAPLFIPVHRRLETSAIVFHLFMFFVSPFLSLFLTIYLLFFTNYWYLVLLYGVWFIYDYETPRKGTRRSVWFRNLSLWKYYHDYFPLKLIKTANFDKNRNYIFGCHPHGIISMGVVNIFGSETENVSERREYYMACGGIEVSKESINYVLNQKAKGNAVVIVVGGAAEALDAFPGTYTVTLENRKGFIKLALQNGAHLVPVISFGENDLYDQVGNRSGTFLRLLQKKLKGVYTYSLPFFYGRGIFNYSFGMLPYRKPVTVVVGKPIEVERVENPSMQQIDGLHNVYKEELVKLFEEHKLDYGVGRDIKMIIV